MYNKQFFIDAVERVASTFVETGLGVIVASQGFGADVWKAAAVAGGLSVAKALLAINVGQKTSASLAPSVGTQVVTVAPPSVTAADVPTVAPPGP